MLTYWCRQKFDRLVTYDRIHKRLLLLRILLFNKFYWARTNENTGQILVGPNALWPLQPKLWVAHAAAPPHATAGMQLKPGCLQTGIYTQELWVCLHLFLLIQRFGHFGWKSFRWPITRPGPMS